MVEWHPARPEHDGNRAPERIPAAGSAATSGASPPAQPRAPLRVNLFFKYVALVFAVVLIALLTNGAFEVWFSYQEYKKSLIRIQHGQAEAAAAKSVSSSTRSRRRSVGRRSCRGPASTLEQRRFDASRLLRQVPAITELSQLDATGHEQLRVSRLAMDVIGSGIDYSNDPKFTEAMAHKVYYGPVYFRRESEPYMTLALAGTHPQRRCVSRGGQPQADLGRGLADQSRRARPCLRGGRTRPADRASRHQSRLAQHRSVASRAGAGCARTSCREADGAGAGSRRYPNTPCAHRLRADRAAWLDHVRRATGRRGLRTALFDARAFRLDPARGFAARAGRRAHAGAPDGGADPGAAARRGAHRLR